MVSRFKNMIHTAHRWAGTPLCHGEEKFTYKVSQNAIRPLLATEKAAYETVQKLYHVKGEKGKYTERGSKSSC